MAQQGVRDPSDEELARESGLPHRQGAARSAGSSASRSGSRPPSATRATAGSSATGWRTSRSPAPDEQLAQGRMQVQTRALLDHLSPREQQLLKLRFGMDGGPGQTLEEVGKSFNLSRERVRQIEAAALKKLRAISEERELGSYIGR